MAVPNGAIEISKKYSFFYLYLKGLKSETPYSIFVIGANAHPGFPDLMETKFIKKLDFTTSKAPANEWLDLSSSLLKLPSLLLGLTCMILVTFSN